MTNKFTIFSILIYVFTISPFSVKANELSLGSKSQSFKINDSREISTQYFSLKLSEISLDNILPPNGYSHKAVGGGVIARIEGSQNILHIDAYGNSTLIDIAQKKLYKDFFPPVDTGAQYLQNSNFYTLIETSPRILGAVNRGDVILCFV